MLTGLATALNFDKVRIVKTWTIPVEPPLHVAEPAYMRSASQPKPRSWSLITEVRVEQIKHHDEDVIWTANAYGVAATKGGIKRGTYTQPVYGPEADELAVAAMRVVQLGDRA